MTENHDHDAQSDDGADQAQSDVPEIEATGHPQIDAALERLHGLDGLDITAHPEEFDAIHGVLRESLANAGRDGVDPVSA
jgi:hypothetical protein